jgi:hypothetical protein
MTKSSMRSASATKDLGVSKRENQTAKNFVPKASNNVYEAKQMRDNHYSTKSTSQMPKVQDFAGMEQKNISS